MSTQNEEVILQQQVNQLMVVEPRNLNSVEISNHLLKRNHFLLFVLKRIRDGEITQPNKPTSFYRVIR